MWKWNKRVALPALLAAFVGVAGACSQGGNGEATSPPASNEPSTSTPAPTPVEPPKPVTLKMMWFNTLVSAEAANQFIIEPVKQQYPHITIEFLEPAPGSALHDRIASGQEIPDIVITDYSNLSSAIDLQYPADMSEYVSREKVNVGAMEDSPLEGVRSLGDNGELYGLPIYLDKYMMFYNKDIFDRFALPHPTSDMSYPELVDLARKLTREEEGIKFLGYRWADLYTFGFQLGLPVIGESTKKAELQTDGWQRALTYMKEMIDVGIDNTITHEHFFKEKRLAIYPQWMGAAYGLIAQEGAGLNWDMAALPYVSDSPKTSGPAKPIYLLASSVSDHKEEAMAAIAHVTTSPEVQTLLSRNGRISVLKDESIRQQFGAELELLQGKNVAAVFQYPFGTLPHTTAYESLAWAGLDTAPVNVIQGMDVNSALRLAEEEANKQVDQYLNSR